MEGIVYVYKEMEHRWGQRVVRFYDIEVGESRKQVCKRFLEEGMTVAEVAERMEVSIDVVEIYL